MKSGSQYLAKILNLNATTTNATVSNIVETLNQDILIPSNVQKTVIPSNVQEMVSNVEVTVAHKKRSKSATVNFSLESPRKVLRKDKNNLSEIMCSCGDCNLVSDDLRPCDNFNSKLKCYNQLVRICKWNRCETCEPNKKRKFFC